MQEISLDILRNLGYALSMNIDRLSINFGPGQEELALAKRVRERAGDKGINRLVKQAVREYLERHPQEAEHK